MQKWFDEGYFSLDLPTKRSHLDPHWITVEDLLRRSSNDKIFLSVPLPPAPPGLTRRIDSPLQSYPGSTEQDVYGGLNHPSPIRTLRNSTLDNYVTTGSNPSDSPSSFGGARFDNGSPDSIGLSARAANSLYYMGPSANDRAASLVNVVDAPAPFITRRATLNDAALDHTLMRPQAYPIITPSRTASMGEYGLNGMYNPGPYIPILDSVASSRNAEPLSLNTYSESPVLEPALNYRNGHDGGFHDNVSGNVAFGQPDYGTTNSGRPGLVSEEASSLNHYNAFGSIASSSVQAQFSQTSSPFLSHANAQPSNLDPLAPHPTANIDSCSDAQAESESSVQPPRQVVSEVSTPQCGASNDVLHPPASTTIILQPPASRISPWGNKAESPQQLTHIKTVSPWTSEATVATASDSWEGVPHHSRLTFSNIVQHNQQYLSSDAQVITDPPNPQEEQIDVPQTPSIENESAVSSDPVQSTRGKINSQLDQERKPEGTGVTVDASDKVDTTAQVPVPKVAWPKEPGPSISLREIQEAEAKKVEARKGIERVTKTSSISVEPKEEVQPFTTSWGLPTSQAGIRSSAPLKEATPASSPSVPAPVWTNAVKSSSAKKSMKEIQEEEERRKRLLAAKEPTLAAAAARKAPPELVNKVGDQSCNLKPRC